MKINRIALEQDLLQNYNETRFNNEWKNEVPVDETTDLDADKLKAKTQKYADLLREKNLREDQVTKAVTFSKAAISAMLESADGIRIYMVAEEKEDENNVKYLDIFPMLVPVSDNFEDKLNFEMGNINFIMDVASKCPPPHGVCNNGKFKLLPD